MHAKRPRVTKITLVENLPAIFEAGIFSRTNFTLVLAVVLLLRSTILLNAFVRKYILCYVLRSVFLMEALFSNDR